MSISPVIFSKRETSSSHALLKISVAGIEPSDSNENTYSPSMSSMTIALSKASSRPVPYPTCCSALSKSRTASTSVHSLFVNILELIARPDLDVRFRSKRVFAFFGFARTAFCALAGMLLLLLGTTLHGLYHGRVLHKRITLDIGPWTKSSVEFCCALP